ncbi:MAG: alpha-E domain-containing protein [Alphaproteobacteria bacterium]|nr:alpha-E domain-containing protein [Alphaproteobacteria bacterium SS10]
MNQHQAYITEANASPIEAGNRNRFLLARYAEALLWLGRYVERAESTARLLSVTHTFSQHNSSNTSWQSVVSLNADDERFKATHPVLTQEAVKHFYLLDSENPSSILSTVRNARENARTLRPVLSSEVWTQLNVFYNRMAVLRPLDIADNNVVSICNFVRESCQSHTGIADGTFPRDQGWSFYRLGKFLERADQITRLVDIKYHILLPRVEDVGTAVDVSQWQALLRAAAGYHAFRRAHPRGIDPLTVAGFLLVNNSFPRSLSFCTTRLDNLLNDLRMQYGLRGGGKALEVIDEMRAAIASRGIDVIVADGLHEYLDWVQSRLIDITDSLYDDFFRPTPQQA